MCCTYLEDEHASQDTSDDDENGTREEHDDSCLLHGRQLHTPKQLERKHKQIQIRGDVQDEHHEDGHSRYGRLAYVSWIRIDLPHFVAGLAAQEHGEDEYNVAGADEAISDQHDDSVAVHALLLRTINESFSPCPKDMHTDSREKKQQMDALIPHRTVTYIGQPATCILDPVTLRARH